MDLDKTLNCSVVSKLSAKRRRYQAPGAYDAFWKSSEGPGKQKHTGPMSRKSTRAGVSAEQFAALGLRTATGHKHAAGRQKQNMEPNARVNIPNTSVKVQSKDDPGHDEPAIVP